MTEKSTKALYAESTPVSPAGHRTAGLRVWTSEEQELIDETARRAPLFDVTTGTLLR